jgi:hypothetical protein
MAGVTDEELIARAPLRRVALISGDAGVGGGLTDAQLRASAVPVTNSGVGAVADAAWSGTGNGTVVAVLKAIWTRLASTPKLGQSTRTLGWATGQHLTISTTAVRSAAIVGTEVLVSLSVPGYVKVGDNTVTAAASAGSLYLPAGPHYMQITSGQFVSVLGSASGVASVIPIA